MTCSLTDTGTRKFPLQTWQVITYSKFDFQFQLVSSLINILASFQESLEIKKLCKFKDNNNNHRHNTIISLQKIINGFFLHTFSAELSRSQACFTIKVKFALLHNSNCELHIYMALQVRNRFLNIFIQFNFTLSFKSYNSYQFCLIIKSLHSHNTSGIIYLRKKL